jgi:hypothetical protein
MICEIFCNLMPVRFNLLSRTIFARCLELTRSKRGRRQKVLQWCARLDRYEITVATSLIMRGESQVCYNLDEKPKGVGFPGKP